MSEAGTCTVKTNKNLREQSRFTVRETERKKKKSETERDRTVRDKITIAFT